MFCVLFVLCFLGPAMPPPAPAVPDGAGGFVPFTNARALPDGSLRPYDPTLDGVMLPDGSIAFPYLPPPGEGNGISHSPPYPAPPAPFPPGRVTVGPPQVLPAPPAPAPRRARKPPGKTSGSEPCYGSNGRWIGENNECQTTQ